MQLPTETRREVDISLLREIRRALSGEYVAHNQSIYYQNLSQRLLEVLNRSNVVDRNEEEL